MDSERQNPYVGSRPFEAEDGRYFFGRDQESRQLASLIIAHQVVLFYAQSGAGKTSLLQASVIPNLVEHGDMAVLPIARVRGDLPPDVELGPGDNIYVFNALFSLMGTGADPRGLVGLSLKDGLQPYLEGHDEDQAPQPSLLVLDQFEELFTTYPQLYEKRAGFFLQLQKSLEAYPQLGLLISMREDYIAQLDFYAAQMPDRLRTRYRMERLAVDGALDAVEGPAARAGRPFAPGVGRELVDNLRRIQVGTAREGRPPEERPLGAHVEPLHLQIVCHRLWSQLPPGGDIIRAEDVLEFGDVDQALTGFYEDTLAAAVKQTGFDQRRLRSWFAGELITPVGTRHLVFRGKQETEGVPNAVVDVLGEAYLIRRLRRGDDVYYELAHDRLVEPIREANRAWRETYLDSIPWLRQAEMWNSQGRPDSLLLRTEALREAERWAAGHARELAPEEEAFLDACRKVREVEQGRNLDELGWGVIFAHGADETVQAALQELLDLRRDQAGERYQAFTGEKAYRPGESAREFLHRQGGRAADVPDYLLIVGDPEEIPYEFQYGLALQCAVGRIHFETLDEYAHYARSVVAAERGQVALPAEAVFFGVQNPDDNATRLSMNELVKPVADRVSEKVRGWQVNEVLGEEATKARLTQVLGGPETPALLFSTCHGMSWPKDHPQQLVHQGALLCADWPGPQEGRGKFPPDFFVSADDIPDHARLLGLIAFLFAENGAGTPRHDNFAHRYGSGGDPRELASRSFVAPLARRLLGHPRGGALAVIGHIDVCWLHTFVEPDGSRDIGLFLETLTRLMAGHTVGSALSSFRRRYTLLSSALGEEMQGVVFGDKSSDDHALLTLLIMSTDVRNYVIVGDPAVHLPLAIGPNSVHRPAIGPVEVAAPVIPEPEPEPVPEPEPELEPVAIPRLEIAAPETEADGVDGEPEPAEIRTAEEPEPESVAVSLLEIAAPETEADGVDGESEPERAWVDLEPEPEAEPVAVPLPKAARPRSLSPDLDLESSLFLNGVNAALGEYLVPPMTARQVAGMARGTGLDAREVRELRWRSEMSGQAHLGLVEGLNRRNVSEAGWGVIFPAEGEHPVAELKDALLPLLDLRRDQAGQAFKEFTYQPGESRDDFLQRHGVATGLADPRRMPYYLLLVGSPGTIPYHFQQQLGLDYAVGRLHFEGPGAYARYAHHVVQAEGAPTGRPQRAVFFGVEHPHDAPTLLSSRYLVGPMAEELSQRRSLWDFEVVPGGQATKARLAELLGGAGTPAILVTAGHGLVFPPDDPRQQAHQGALLCADWPGPQAWQKPVPPDLYFSAGDLDAGAELQGLILLHLASFGAGTPSTEELAEPLHDRLAPFTQRPFVARLPQRLLSRGALAVVGQTAPVWNFSLSGQHLLERALLLADALDHLCHDTPVGLAFQELGTYYARLATELATELEDIEWGKAADDDKLATLWAGSHDAHTTVILGDPAVRINSISF